MSSGSHALDTDTQKPPPTNTSKLKSFTNGAQKHHHPTTAQRPQPPSMVVSYKECLKNHAASIGGHALDGCGEFMPSSSTNPTDPRSLKCAACGCHRNFHRRDPQEPLPPSTTTTTNNNPNNPPFLTCFYSTTPSSAPPQPPPPPPLPHRARSQTTSPSLSSSPSHSPSPMSSPSSPPPLSHLPPSSFHTSSAPHMLLALGNAYSAAPSEEHHHYQRNFNSYSLVLKTENNPTGKKRYRTKFSQEQKEKMQSFSEKLGWRMQKGDDGLVQEFCNDIGVSRGVFKVWMHNNKNTFRKRSSEVVGIANAPPQTEEINGDHDEDNGNHGGGGGFDSDINNDIHRNEDSCVNVHVSINGLSS